MDKGYTEALTDSDGQHHGTQLGKLLTSESDYRKVKSKRRAKIRAVAEKAEQRGDLAKAQRIRDNNLGTTKRDRRSAAWKCRVRDIRFKAVHAVADKASVIVAEDLTKTFSSRKKLGKNMNRRLAAWTKGITAEALETVSGRRGSAVRLVNAAYTSQVVPFTDILGATTCWPLPTAGRMPLCGTVPCRVPSGTRWVVHFESECRGHQSACGDRRRTGPIPSSR